MSTKTVLSPQCAAVLSELRVGARTTLQIMRSTGILRVGAVIHVLRIAGHDIETNLVQVRTRYAKRVGVAMYSLRRRRGRPARVKVRK